MRGCVDYQSPTYVIAVCVQAVQLKECCRELLAGFGNRAIQFREWGAAGDASSFDEEGFAAKIAPVTDRLQFRTKESRMTEPTKPAAAGIALIVCSDAGTVELIVNSLRPLAIRSEICEDVSRAALLLETNKFEAVIIDLLLGEGALVLMEQLRFSRANRTVVTFAITALGSSRARLDSTFVLPRPLTTESLNQTFRAAYGLVVRERRRYFRCAIVVPLFVKAQQPSEFLCQTVNVSEGGIAVKTSTMPASTVPVAVRFSLPERSGQFFSQTKICWRGAEGLLGLEFLSLSNSQKADLQEWLARKLDETLPENVVALFRSAGQSPQ